MALLFELDLSKSPEDASGAAARTIRRACGRPIQCTPMHQLRTGQWVCMQSPQTPPHKPATYSKAATPPPLPRASTRMSSASSQIDTDRSRSPRRQSSCGRCGGMPVSEERLDVVGKLYCAPCWAIWDRCGQWPSALRVKTTMPPIGAAGLPVFAPDEAYCIADFASSLGDESVLMRLRSEMPQYQEWHGGRHHALHFQDWSPDQGIAPQILKNIATKLEATFGIKASSVRVNRYRSQADYKPLHHDRRHDVNGRPQYTVGLSLGAKRELVLVHRRTSFTVNFPLANGSVFAFGPELNDQFLHGVPMQASNLSLIHISEPTRH
eukprot:4694855-Karenia_brevis.AAC.1